MQPRRGAEGPKGHTVGMKPGQDNGPIEHRSTTASTSKLWNVGEFERTVNCLRNG